MAKSFTSPLLKVRTTHYKQPYFLFAVQASIAANTYVVSGPNEAKQLTELLPGIMNQLGPDNIDHLKQIADNISHSSQHNTNTTHSNLADVDDEDVPDLVENFEDVSKT